MQKYLTDVAMTRNKKPTRLDFNSESYL